MGTSRTRRSFRKQLCYVLNTLTCSSSFSLETILEKQFTIYIYTKCLCWFYKIVLREFLQSRHLLARSFQVKEEFSWIFFVISGLFMNKLLKTGWVPFNSTAEGCLLASALNRQAVEDTQCLAQEANRSNVTHTKPLGGFAVRGRL